MRPVSSRWLISVGLLLGAIGLGPRASARDEDQQEEVQPPVRRRAVVFINNQQFDQWFFEHEGGAEAARHAMEAHLLARIRAIAFSHYLTGDQEKKLEVAGKRDIQRYFDAVREKEELLNRVGQDHLQMRLILQSLQLSKRHALGNSVLDEGSLFSKVLDKTLNAGQDHIDVKASVYRLSVDRAVSLWDSQLGLSRRQHDNLVSLITQETPALRRYGEFEVDAVAFQASRIPRERFERILEGFQVQRLEQNFRDLFSFRRVLIANGYIEEGGPTFRPTAGVNHSEREDRLARPASRAKQTRFDN